MAGKMSEANGMVEFFDKTTAPVIDIWEPMLGEDGKPRRELFVGDGLHLNAKGYALWTKVVAPQQLGADRFAVWQGGTLLLR